jgi:hypothetical protein
MTSSVAIEDLRELCRNFPQKGLAYWYFQFSDQATQNVCNMMKSFIRQLSWPTLLPTIKKMLDEHKARGSEPGIGELTNALDEVIDSIEGEVFIVMDALDECPQTTDRLERKELLGRIRTLLGKHSNNLHILATSRPGRDIVTWSG